MICYGNTAKLVIGAPCPKYQRQWQPGTRSKLHPFSLPPHLATCHLTKLTHDADTSTNCRLRHTQVRRAKMQHSSKLLPAITAAQEAGKGIAPPAVGCRSPVPDARGASMTLHEALCCHPHSHLQHRHPCDGPALHLSSGRQ